MTINEPIAEDNGLTPLHLLPNDGRRRSRRLHRRGGLEYPLAWKGGADASVGRQRGPSGRDDSGPASLWRPVANVSPIVGPQRRKACPGRLTATPARVVHPRPHYAATDFSIIAARACTGPKATFCSTFSSGFFTTNIRFTTSAKGLIDHNAGARIIITASRETEQCDARNPDPSVRVV